MHEMLPMIQKKKKKNQNAWNVTHDNPSQGN